jgi:DNA mismatch repair protein MutL
MTTPTSVPVAGRRPIVRLPEETVHRIAAGEVVERPSSVVKELLENAIDAGAREVTVRLQRGGLARIEVADDGQGIPANELELAVERHATSKLDPEEGLGAIRTLGFRGEALASIASVSRLRLRSRPPDSEVAMGIAVEGGTVRGRFESGRGIGTTVEVEDLFFNTPARRKFLHAPAVEQLEVVRTIEHLYLASPSVTLSLVNESGELANFPGASDLRDAAARVLGSEFLEQSFELNAEMPRAGRLHGFLGRPSLAVGNARRLYLAVNGRTIDSRVLAQATRFAFQSYIPRTRFPVGVLHLELPPEEVDVNVHPTKREVRFVQESELAERVRQAVRQALVGAPAPLPLPPALTSRTGVSAPASPPGPPAARSSGSRIPSGIQRPLVEPSGPLVLHDRPGHPRLQLLGSLDRLYWVAVAPRGFVLIDQHAASERLLFDALVREGRLGCQTLMEPVTVDLRPSQQAALQAHAEAVRGAGFDVEAFGGTSFRVRGVPSYRGQRASASRLPELLDELAAGGRPTLPNGPTERIAASIACHAAIRAGDVVSPEELGRVVDALYEGAEAVYSCPHGRPILFDLPRSRIDRWFLRTGP